MCISALSKLKPYRFRILAVCLFLMLLVSTWLMFHRPPAYPESLHVSLRMQLQQIIRDTLLKKVPSATNIQFKHVWTEAGDRSNTIVADFQYSYSSEDTDIQVNGSALIIKKALVSSKDHNLWVVRSIRTDDTIMNFEHPIVLLPGQEEQEEVNEAEKEAETEAEKEAEQDLESNSDNSLPYHEGDAESNNKSNQPEGVSGDESGGSKSGSGASGSGAFGSGASGSGASGSGASGSGASGSKEFSDENSSSDDYHQ